MAGMRVRAVGLVQACHPGPTVAVTAFATALAVRADLTGPTVLRVALAVLAGQLSIGWLNDLHDRELDRAAGRADKPLAHGAVQAGQLRIAIAAAAIACVGLSLSLGWTPGLLHLGAVVSAWIYDLWLKPTRLSWLPFAVSFGLLPAVATTARSGSPWPAWEVVVAGALLGVAAHLANTVKDVDADRLTGVRGLPQRIGPEHSLRATAVLVGLAAAVIVVAAPRAWASWVFGSAAAGAAITAGLGPRRTAFVAVVLAAALAVVGVVVSGAAAPG